MCFPMSKACLSVSADAGVQAEVFRLAEVHAVQAATLLLRPAWWRPGQQRRRRRWKWRRDPLQLWKWPVPPSPLPTPLLLLFSLHSLLLVLPASRWLLRDGPKCGLGPQLRLLLLLFASLWWTPREKCWHGSLKHQPPAFLHPAQGQGCILSAYIDTLYQFIKWIFLCLFYLKVLSHLTVKERCLCASLVCKYWRDLCLDFQFWKQIDLSGLQQVRLFSSCAIFNAVVVKGGEIFR